MDVVFRATKNLDATRSDGMRCDAMRSDSIKFSQSTHIESTETVSYIFDVELVRFTDGVQSLRPFAEGMSHEADFRRTVPTRPEVTFGRGDRVGTVLYTVTISIITV